MNTLRLCVTLMLGALCGANIREVPLPKEVQECYDISYDPDPSNFVGSKLSFMCEGKSKHSQLGEDDANTISLRLWASFAPGNNTAEGTTGSRRKRQSRCVRQEYRRLSDDSRRRFHNAVNAMKRDTSERPNKYDAIARLHARWANSLHLGTGFLGAHRQVLNRFEDYLKEQDDAVCLPYWATILDGRLQDSSRSNIWTPAFMGTSNGAVVEGPFANWITPNGSPLMRNVDGNVDLFTDENMRNILNMTWYENITYPRASLPYNMEIHHGGPHMHIGGTMSQVDTSAYDPIFFLYHCFIDHIFELFRTGMRSAGRNPELYPNIHPRTSPHYRSAPTGFNNVNQANAFRDEFARGFVYEPIPTCTSSSLDCGSRYLTCEPSTLRCVPTTRSTAVTSLSEATITENEVVPLALLPDPPITQSPGVSGAQLPGGVPNDTSCLKPETSLGQAIQNDFCCDNKCDSNEWVVIPVKIINVRPPKFNKYKSYPVHNGRIDRNFDIYSPRAYNQTNRFITQRRSNPKTYNRCKIDDNVGQVLLTSRGINYHGFYQESAIVDQRQAASISMGFVAVMKPVGANVSKAIIRAHDSCGRVCKAACLDPLTGHYKECKGAIAVSAEKPLMYGTTYDEAVMSVFDYKYNSNLPQFRTKSVFLSFYCDYQSKFPYTSDSSGKVTESSEAKNISAVAPPSNTAKGRECLVTPQCILDIPCVSKERQCSLDGEKHICRGSCQEYAVCVYGQFFVKGCPEGHSFDNVHKICVPGGCKINPVTST